MLLVGLAACGGSDSTGSSDSPITYAALAASIGCTDLTPAETTEGVVATGNCSFQGETLTITIYAGDPWVLPEGEPGWSDFRDPCTPETAGQWLTGLSGPTWSISTTGANSRAVIEAVIDSLDFDLSNASLQEGIC